MKGDGVWGRGKLLFPRKEVFPFPKNNIPLQKERKQDARKMSRHTFFTDNIGTEGSYVELSKDQRHHLFKVFRAVCGDEVELLDGRGTRALGEVDAEKNVIIKSVKKETPEEVKLHLVFAVPRKNQLDLLLKQAAELGVSELHPVRFERSVSQADGKERWTTLLEEACKQSKNPFLPQIHPAAGLEDKLNELSVRNIPVVFGAIRSETGKLKLENSAAWVIGPEGGFTDEEEQLMRAKGAIPLNLGPWVLRLETAACAGIAVLRQLIGVVLLAVVLLAGCTPNAANDPFCKKAERARNGGNYQSALALYRKAISRHPDAAELYLKTASLCDESLDDPAGAVFYYTEYLKLAPEDHPDVPGIRSLRDLAERKLYRRLEKKYADNTELDKLRRQNSMLLQNNRTLAKLLADSRKNANVQTASKQAASKTSVSKQSKPAKKQKRPAKKR